MPTPLTYTTLAALGPVETAADKLTAALALTVGFRRLVDNEDPPADASGSIVVGPAVDPWDGEAAAHADDLSSIGCRAYIGQPEEDGEGVIVTPGSAIAGCPNINYTLRIILRRYLRNIDTDRNAVFRYVSDCMTAIGPQLGYGLRGSLEYIAIRQTLTPAFSSDQETAGQVEFIESVWIVDLGDRGASDG